jgi:hypothetical protein
VPLGVVPALPTIAFLVDQQASILAYMDNSKVVALVSLLNLPLVALLRKPEAA